MTEQPRDLARYLPLSIRPRVDESGVTNDWRSHLDELVSAVAAITPGDHTAFEAAVEHARRRRRVRIGDLGAVLVAGYELCGERLVVATVVTGAVCLARALSAPLAIRAVVRGRTLSPTDADWRLGSGPELVGTARELVLFVYGRGGLPER